MRTAQIMVAIWLPSGSVCTNSSHSASEGPLWCPLMLKTREGNIILSKFHRAGMPPTSQSPPGIFLRNHPWGVFKFFKALKNLTTNKHTLTNSVDTALGSFPPMVLSLWKKNQHALPLEQQDCVRVQAQGWGLSCRRSGSNLVDEQKSLLCWHTDSKQ